MVIALIFAAPILGVIVAAVTVLPAGLLATAKKLMRMGVNVIPAKVIFVLALPVARL